MGGEGLGSLEPMGGQGLGAPLPGGSQRLLVQEGRTGDDGGGEGFAVLANQDLNTGRLSGGALFIWTQPVVDLDLPDGDQPDRGRLASGPVPGRGAACRMGWSA